MHILHVIDSLGLGGAERMAIDLANATVADGHRVSMCVTRNATTLAAELDPRVELVVLDRRSKLSIVESTRFIRWIRHNNVDVMHVHMRHVLTYVLALRATYTFRVPIVFHDHYGTIEIDTSVPRWFPVARRFIAHYVGVYDRLTDWAISAGIPRSHATTIENVIDLRRIVEAAPRDLRKELGLTNVPLGLLVATIRPDKGIETLIDAVAEMTHPVHVAIAGSEGDPVYAAACRQRIVDKGVSAKITLLGGRTDVPSILRSVDFAVLSSHTESGPLVLIEYLAARRPFVSTRVGDIGRRLDARGVSAFVPPSQPHALARALDELLALGTDERAERVTRGARALDHGWTLPAVMPRWYAVYRSVLRR